MAFVRIIAAAACPPNRGTYVEVGDQQLAVFHLTDPQRFAVTDALCPHAGGDLAGGEVTGSMVACPWHHWEFEVTTGVCPRNHAANIASFPVELRDGFVYADLDSPFKTGPGGQTPPLPRPNHDDPAAGDCW